MGCEGRKADPQLGSFFVERIHRIGLSRACERREPAQPSTLQNKFSCSKAPPYSAPIAEKFTYTLLLPFERSVERDQEGADSQLATNTNLRLSSVEITPPSLTNAYLEDLRKRSRFGGTTPSSKHYNALLEMYVRFILE
jgi:hypothetical protein